MCVVGSVFREDWRNDTAWEPHPYQELARSNLGAMGSNLLEDIAERYVA